MALFFQYLTLGTTDGAKITTAKRTTMKKIFLLVSFLASLFFSVEYASASSAERSLEPVSDITRSHAELQQFAREEQEAIHWNQRYAQAPAGSWEESYARQNRDQAIQRALQVINSYHAFSGLYSQQIESFADEMNRKYTQASVGSAMERLYREAMRSAYTAFRSAILEEVRAISYDWRRLHELALRLDQAYAQASAGSQKEAAYNEARRLAYQNLPSSVEQELPRYQDFRQLEEFGLYFERLYVSASAGSLKENVYRQIYRRVFDEALNKARWQLRTYPHQALYQIQDEYNRKYTSASAGSFKESYYRQIRDLARSLLGQYP